MTPRATFKITGEIDDFKKIDNLYSVMKREGAKLLKNWVIEIDASYSESKAEVE